MEIYAEFTPQKSLMSTRDRAAKLGDYDGFDIPHSPLGLPSMLPVAIACSLRDAGYNKKIILNQRLSDVNELFIRSLVITAKALGADLAFTIGDAPKFGEPVNHLDSEGALKITKTIDKGVKVGLFISLRHSREKVLSRLNSEADFFLTMRVNRVEDLTNLTTNKMIVYVLISTERNKNLLGSIGQPSVTLSELGDFMSSLRATRVAGALLSAPADDEALFQAFKYI
ncbi:MAG: hypothetical protein ACP5T2_04685 [Thermoprotei archaeon]